MKILSALAFAASLQCFALDSYTLCMSPKPPEGFKLLVKESVYFEGQPTGFPTWGNEAHCKELAKQIESSVGAGVSDLASNGQYLPLLKSLGVLWVSEKSPIESLKGIGFHENLHRLVVRGPLRLNQFADLSWYNNRLRTLHLIATDKDSFVDLEQLPQFNELTSLGLNNLKVLNATSTDRIPKLNYLNLKDVVLDERPTFAHVPPDMRTFDNVKVLNDTKSLPNKHK